MGLATFLPASSCRERPNIAYSPELIDWVLFNSADVIGVPLARTAIVGGEGDPLPASVKKRYLILPGGQKWL
jgi:hypothetical protein